MTYSVSKFFFYNKPGEVMKRKLFQWTKGNGKYIFTLIYQGKVICKVFALLFEYCHGEGAGSLDMYIVSFFLQIKVN